MATVNFYLDKPNSKNERLILMTYQNRGLKFRYSTKIKIKEKIWDFKAQRIKRNVLGDLEINSHLKNLEEKINAIERQALLEEKPLTLNYVKEQFNSKVNKASKSTGFFDYWQEYIDKSKGFKNDSTIRVYVTVKNTLQRFAELYKLTLSFDDINNDFYEGYLEYLMNECNYLNNTIGSHIKTIKSFMAYATEKKYNKNLSFQSFKVYKENVDIVYLTEEELLKLYYLEGLSKSQEYVRDNFCFGCFTGLRFSDISRVLKENFKGEFLEIVTQKTKDFIKIPLNDYAKQIIQKYSGGLPRSISNQKTNDILKEIGEIAELNEVVIKRKFKGVKVIEVCEPKYKMLSSHAARRTFVTLSLEKGMRPETVMSITGHKDYATFKKYIKLTDNVRLLEMNKIWNNGIKIA